MRESELLQHIYRANPTLPGRVIIPPGDDMGGLQIGAEQVLITVDQLADGVHFDLRAVPLEKIARKAITRNLSDVAAMAALPCGAVVAACLPRHFGTSSAQRLFDEIRAVSASYGCPVIGGDIAMWDHPLILSVTVLAVPAGVTPVRRDGARVGDWVCVTGRLGGSMQALRGYIHHLDFEPRLTLARKLASTPGLTLHSMIDLSDGLGIDLGRVCEASGVSAQLWADRLPISEAAEMTSRADGVEPWRHALGDGEDYELCFTVPAEQAHRCLPAQIDGVPITPVGVVTPVAVASGNGKPTVTIKFPDGSIRAAGDSGWDYCG
jgi:thiamine-monophosphate kinase